MNIKKQLGIGLLAAMLLPWVVQAKNIGNYGPVHEISEEDFLEYIERTLLEKQKSGELARKMEEGKKRVLEGIEQPAGANLPRATEKQVHYYDPSIIISQDILDDKGNVIAKRGSTHNPLDLAPITKKLLFFDGRDQQQVQYMLNVAKKDIKVVPVMVIGKPLELMRESKQRVYFDQHQKLIQRFGVNQLPSWVLQEGKKMRVESVPLDKPMELGS